MITIVEEYGWCDVYYGDEIVASGDGKIAAVDSFRYFERLNYRMSMTGRAFLNHVLNDEEVNKIIKEYYDNI